MNKTTALSLLMLFSASSELMAKHFRKITIVNMTQGPVSILVKDHKQPTSAAVEKAKIPGLPYDDASNYETRMTIKFDVLDSQDIFVQYHQIKRGTDTVIRYQIPDCATHFIVPTNVINDPLLPETKKQKDVTLDEACVANKELEAQAKLAQAE